METLNTVLLLILLAAVIYLVSQGGARKTPKASGHHKMILDSCALIDGRIIDLANSGFVPAELIVPEFVINELQLLADGSDSHKRERARFGLDVIKELQNNKYCDLIIDKMFAADKQPTDDKLVQGVNVLNVNELAQQLRPSVLPGERRSVKIIQKGSNHNQGVGYLDDGTMVVVEAASRSIGKTIEVEIDRTFQTVAGKMIFAQPVERPSRPVQQ
jgi:uncharacterized protein YacL